MAKKANDSREAQQPKNELLARASKVPMAARLPGTDVSSGTEGAVRPGTTSEKRGGGKILVKAFAIDSQTGQVLLGAGEAPSKQILDPFNEMSAYGQTLRLPPLNLEQLVTLAESHPVHAAAIEQKSVDIVSNGLNLEPKDEFPEAEEKQKTEIMKWFENLFEDYTSLEVMLSAWSDYETIGWGIMEVSRMVSGKVGKLYYIPAHTVRAHMNGYLFAQVRMGRFVWFKKWNTPGTFYSTSGRVAPEDTPLQKQSNELLVFRKPARRSIWYGIPSYISGIGHLAMAVAARDFNIKFFDNYREPRHLIIITGLEEDVETAADNIEQIWKTQLKDNPHANVLLPISGEAKVIIEKMGLPMNDMHFARMMSMVDEEILVSHRMPPDRVGMVASGRGFGGTGIGTMNAIYKDGVVAKGQNILESRLNRFIDTEYRRSTGQEVQWKVKLQELDIADRELDTGIVLNEVKSNLITINEGRTDLGKDALDLFKDMSVNVPPEEEGGEATHPDLTLAEFLSKHGAPQAAMAAMFGPEALLQPTQKQVNEQIMKRLSDIDGYIEELIHGDGSTPSFAKQTTG